MKKALRFCLSIILLVSVLSLLVGAEEATVLKNGILYSADQTVLLNCTEKYNGGSVLAIPDGVTQIADGAFMGNTTIQTVFFPTTLQKIGNDSFRDSALTTADLSGCPELTRICNSAFAGCVRLTSVSLPRNAEIIEESVFRGCAALHSVRFGETVVPDSCFIGCQQLKTVTVVLPDGVEKTYRPGKLSPNDESALKASDARSILRLAAELDLTLEYMIFGADVNRDGKITAVDARTVLRVAAHLDTL